MLGATVAAMVEAAVVDGKSDVCGASVSISSGVDGESGGIGVVNVSDGSLVFSTASVWVSDVGDSGIGVVSINGGADCGASVVRGSGVSVLLIAVVNSSVGSAVSDSCGVEVLVGSSGVGGAGVGVNTGGVGVSLSIISVLHHFQSQHNRQFVSFPGHSISEKRL